MLVVTSSAVFCHCNRMLCTQVGTKSVRQCTEFYFLWKKVCVDEWRRMRVLRRRRIQDYQLRSTTDQSDLKADDDSISVSDTQVDGIATDVSKFDGYVVYLAGKILDICTEQFIAYDDGDDDDDVFR